MKHETVKYIDESLKFHKQAGIALGNVRKYIKLKKQNQAQRAFDHYSKLSDEFLENMKKIKEQNDE